MQKRFARSLVAAAGAAALTAWASPAYAKSCGGSQPPTNGSAAVAQYVEQINTATGSCATGYGKPHVKPLKPSVQRKLTQQGGSDAPILQQVATSSTYGAPQDTVATTSKTSSTAPRTTTKPRARPTRRTAPARRATGAKLPDVRTDPAPAKALSAAGNVVTDGSNSRLIGLVAILVAITLVALGAATYRQRTQRG